MTDPLRAPRRSRWLAVAGVAALALGACSSGDDTDEQAVQATGAAPAAVAPAPETTVPAIPSLEAPARIAEGAPEVPTAGDADEQVTAPAAEPADLPAEVELVTPRVVVRGGDQPLPTAGLDEIAEDETLHAAAVTAFDVGATGASGETGDLEALQVGIADFRPFTPDVTAQNAGVWQRLADGDVVVRHDVAHALGLELGGTVTLRTPAGTLPARIGAFAANGAPPFADVLVPASVGDQLGAGPPNTLVVGPYEADAAPSPEALADQLAELLEADAEVIQRPKPQETQVKQAGRVTLEPFTYTSRGDGTIAIDGNWVADNIVPVEIPGMGATRCHKVMVPQLQAALREVADAGLYDHFDPRQFAGCFVARHILWNPQRGLSMHAWGLAIDFNARDNAYGAVPQMDRRIVEIFEKWGFSWGGWWSTPDGMHFELERVVEVG